MDNIANKINDIYKNVSYFDKYGGSLLLSIFALLIFFLIISYMNVITNIQPLKRNWNNIKCSPSVIPFAGIINKPDGMSAFEFTSRNFNGCVNNILESIANQFIRPFNQSGNIVSQSIRHMVKTINDFRARIAEFTDNFISIDKQIMGKIFNILLPLRYMIAKIKDTLARTQATLVTSLYTILSTFIGIKSALSIFINFMIIGLVALFVIITALVASFFGIPFAIPMAITYAIVFAKLVPIIGALRNIVDVTQSNPPSTPSTSCFDENTPIRMINGSYKPIKDVYPNEILYGNMLVTSKMKLSTKNNPMYKYNNTIVSGSHQVYINGKMTKIQDVEDAELIENYDKPFIYCMNTDTKILQINDDIYCDWDEINEGNLYLLYKRIGSKFSSTFNRKDIHKYLDGGFIKNTMITMKDGSKKPIQDVQVEDILYGDTRVYGIVQVTTNNMNVYHTTLQNTEIVGAPNLQVYNENLGHFSHYKPKSVVVPIESKPTILYHLLTENKRIHINGSSFYDYNGCLDVILQIHPTTNEYKKYVKGNKNNEDYLTSPQFNAYNHYICNDTNKPKNFIKRLFDKTERKERKREKYMQMLAKHMK